MGNRKITKEELKQPDAFITMSDRAMETIAKNFKPVAVVLGVLFIAGFGLASYNWLNLRKERAGGEALFAAQDQYRKILEADNAPDDKAESEDKDKKVPKAEVKKVEPEKTPELLQEKFSGVLRNYRTVISDHKNTQASYMAALEMADLMAEHRDVAGAKDVLSSLLKDLDADNFFFGLLKTQLGTLLASEKKWEEAIGEYQAVLDSKAHDYLHPDVLIKLGLAFEAKGDFEKARTMYQRASDEHPNSDAGRSAKAYLNLLALKKEAAGTTAEVN